MKYKKIEVILTISLFFCILYGFSVNNENQGNIVAEMTETDPLKISDYTTRFIKSIETFVIHIEEGNTSNYADLTYNQTITNCVPLLSLMHIITCGAI